MVIILRSEILKGSSVSAQRFGSTISFLPDLYLRPTQQYGRDWVGTAPIHSLFVDDAPLILMPGGVGGCGGWRSGIGKVVQ
jgi:hypothetical protein